MNKKWIWTIAIIVAVIIGGYIFYKKTMAPTDIVLVNFTNVHNTAIVKSNDSKWIKYSILSAEEIDKIKSHDMAIVFGMGLKITEEQRAELHRLKEKGFPLYVFASTNPANEISSLDSLQQERLISYLQNRNRRNNRNLALYVRKYIDEKAFFTPEPEPAVESAIDVFYHIDDNVYFDTVAEYETYLTKIGQYKEGGKRIALIDVMSDPFSGNKAQIDAIIKSFSGAGMNIYPITSFAKRLEMLQAVKPDAVLLFAHGRMLGGQGDRAVEWLRERNIPLFAPLTIFTTQEEWENDPMGMMGGFLSQSVVMPELDGAIYPYVLTTQELDKEGLYVSKAVPERLETFTELVGNFMQLKEKPNAEKKVAIVYFKGPGQSTLAAQGLETPESIYNLLLRLRAEGYKVENLPPSAKAFEKLLMDNGAIFNTYAEGAFDKFLASSAPLLIPTYEYEEWVAKTMKPDMYQQVTDLYGDAPGQYMSVSKDDEDYLAVARLDFGNVVLLPQPMAGLGDDSFAIIHGADSPPSHTYIAPYLWIRYGFKADAMIHFGTHGSLEFTPSKQVALSGRDWGDILTGSVPHFYYYTIANIGEAIAAKRRSYATLVSYLTPPFQESNVRGTYQKLMDAIDVYNKADEGNKERANLKAKKITVELGLHRDLRLDSVLTVPYSQADIERIENFAEELSNEKMVGQLYTTGVPYEPEKVKSTVRAMSADPIAYSLSALDRLKGKVSIDQIKNNRYFTQHYLEPAKQIVDRLYSGRQVVNEAYIAKLAGVGESEVAQAMQVVVDESNPRRPQMAAEREMSKGMSVSHGDQKPSSTPPSEDELRGARAIAQLYQTVSNVQKYKLMLEESPEAELTSMINALSGGYISPSSGGDNVANPRAIPTGRNLYSINADMTPTDKAWENGKALADVTIKMYQDQHNGEYPRKVSYTFWSSEFIETEGATIAQALYLLGVRPIRDVMGRVSDLELIPLEELGRPRIDVVVQTSGQFRDLAASRLALLSRAVSMAAEASEADSSNYVRSGTLESERRLVDAGVPPVEARKLATRRVFGGVNGMYGTGIQEMIQASDRWESEQEISDVYLNNMGASYDDPEEWGIFEQNLFRVALHNTDAVVQPRQSNTWGALSLDHVYEFMGGLSLAVREVTGKDPDAYFSDYRNRNNVRMQELKEAIGVESRTTVFNPEFVRQMTEGGSSSAGRIEEFVTNTFGWNVAKPDVIDKEMWDQYYEIYVNDSFGLDVPQFFERESPSVLQEVTAIMLEASRKGMWKATPEQIAHLATVHTDLTAKYGASGKGHAGSNRKLQEYIARNVAPEKASAYKQDIRKMEKASGEVSNSTDGVVMKKHELQRAETEDNTITHGLLIASGIIVAFVLIIVAIRRRRKRQ